MKYNIIILFIGIRLINIFVNGGIVGKVIFIVLRIIRKIVFGVRME